MKSCEEQERSGEQECEVGGGGKQVGSGRSSKEHNEMLRALLE